MTGRTVSRYNRIYIDGYDMSGMVNNVGPLLVQYSDDASATLSEGVKGTMLGHPTIGLGAVNAIFDTTATSGSHTRLATAGGYRYVTVAVGDRAVPAQGDVCFNGYFPQQSYATEIGENATTVTIPFSMAAAHYGLNYRNPWGVLLHYNTAETGANTADGINQTAAATAAGGYMMWHILSYVGTGSATITIEESTTAGGVYSNANIAALTTGAIAHTAMPCAGMAQLGVTADVKKFVRWQVSLDTLTSVTFVLAFIRG